LRLAPGKAGLCIIDTRFEYASTEPDSREGNPAAGKHVAGFDYGGEFPYQEQVVAFSKGAA
jgi:hypothetical protein